MQEICNWHLGEIAFSFNIQNTGKIQKVKLYFMS